MTVGGGAATVAAAGLNAPHEIAVTADGGTLYVIERSSGRVPFGDRLVRVPLPVGPAEVVAADLSTVGGLVLDEGAGRALNVGSGGCANRRHDVKGAIAPSTS